MPRLIKTKGSTWQVQQFGLGLAALDWRDGISVGALRPMVADILMIPKGPRYCYGGVLPQIIRVIPNAKTLHSTIQ